MRTRESKVVLLGASAVGKTSLAYRFCSNQFNDSLATTLGAAFTSKNLKVRDKDIKFQIWDTAGQEKYRALLPLYYRDSQMAILVFDVHKEDTLEQLGWWIEQLADNGPRNIIQVIVGNKIDISGDYSALKQQAEKLAEENKSKLFLISCKTGEGVQDVFNYLGEKYLDKLGNDVDKKRMQQSTIYNEPTSSTLMSKSIMEPKKKEEGCC